MDLEENNQHRSDDEDKRSHQESNLNKEVLKLSEDELIDEDGKSKDANSKSKNKTGVVYLTKIPPGRNYTRLREIFEKFAPIGNIYLVPDKQANDKLQKKGKTYKCYKEGFVEFKRKKDAKNFTSIFNGASLKNSGTDSFIWDLRYLHR